jgi:signal transduction histidine kinase
VAHDLRQPLFRIDGFGQLLLAEHGAALDAGARECLESVLRATRAMDNMIDDLLMLSRVSRTELRRATVDLSALARELLDTLRHHEPGRAVHIELMPGLSARGDPGLLRIALDNLLGNAWKYTGRKPQSRIEFGATLQGEEQVYFVRDNGAGFDMKNAHHLFNTFQRLHSASEFPGTGIGLTTVQRIVRRHGGRIWAQAAVGEGAAFYFTLP